MGDRLGIPRAQATRLLLGSSAAAAGPVVLLFFLFALHLLTSAFKALGHAPVLLPGTD